MNDEELRQRLLEPIGEGDAGFWSSVDRSLDDVQRADEFVTAVPAEDAGLQPPRATPAGFGTRSFRAVLAAAAVLIIGAAGLASGLFDRAGDSVLTKQPGAESPQDEPDEDDFATPLDSLPAGTEICYAATNGQDRSVARAELVGDQVLSGYVVFPSSVSLSGEAAMLVVVDRFVGRQQTVGATVTVDVTRFDGPDRTRRNVEWTITAGSMRTEDTELARITCDPQAAALATGAGDIAETGLDNVPLPLDLVSGVRSSDRSLDLRPVDEGSGGSVLGLSGVDLRSGETMAFRFEADAGDVINYELAASSPPAGVILVGPADLVLAIGSSRNGVTVPHTGTHQLLVAADVGTALSITVSD